MNLTGDYLRGHTDMILLAILNEKDSYGYEINKELETASEGVFVLTEATLYTSFKRLVANKYVLAYWQESQTGKKRKYYQITASGKAYLKAQREAWEKAKTIIDSFHG